ncbi:MAG TPA: hypothetical protein VE553_04260 [Candidatus Binatia bacterium]|nr:hypothetical protein [Candidatus Binatia bacterium]
MKRIAVILVLLLVLLLPSGFALASPNDRIVGEGETVHEDITVVDDTLIVEAGGTVDGKVTVFSGSADIEGHVTGDVTVFGGEISLTGVVDGDLVIFGGNLQLSSDAVIGGDCLSVGGELDDNSDSISCSSFGNRLGSLGLGQMPPIPDVPARPDEPDRPALPDVPAMPDAPTPPRIEVRPPSLVAHIGEYLLEVSAVIGRSLLMGILALVVTAVFPRQLQYVSNTVRTKPAASGAVGLLTAIAGPSIIVLLLVVLAITCVGLLLYPAVFLLGLALFAALIMGWIAVGDILGRLVLGWLNVKPSLPLTAALGTALLTLVLGGLGLVPFIWGESIVVVLLACVGLGAATLTQFGTKRYPPDAAPPVDPDKEEAVLKNLPAQ